VEGGERVKLVVFDPHPRPINRNEKLDTDFLSLVGKLSEGFSLSLTLPHLILLSLGIQSFLSNTLYNINATWDRIYSA
jgi:hypothetical protein